MLELDGDPHNFNHKVSWDLSGEFLFKPRPLTWEWLFLGGDSPLAQFLRSQSIREDDLWNAPWHHFPRLRFPDVKSQHFQGRVEFCQVKPCDEAQIDPVQLAETFGGLVAWASWFGIGDLHYQNLLFGLTPSGSLILSPIDIEFIFCHYSSPTQTLLLADAHHNTARLSGFSLISHLFARGRPGANLAAAAFGYCRTLRFLNQHSDTIVRILGKTPRLNATPVRVAFRETGSYVRHLRLALQIARKPGNETPFLREEKIQLDRGDVPYFFKFLESPAIYYYTNQQRTRFEEVRKSGRKLLPDHFELLPLDHCGSRHARFKRLEETGLCELLMMLDRGKASGEFYYKDIRIHIGSRTIRIERAEAKQDLLGPRILRAA